MSAIGQASRSDRTNGFSKPHTNACLRRVGPKPRRMHPRDSSKSIDTGLSNLQGSRVMSKSWKVEPERFLFAGLAARLLSAGSSPMRLPPGLLPGPPRFLLASRGAEDACGLGAAAFRRSVVIVGRRVRLQNGSVSRRNRDDLDGAFHEERIDAAVPGAVIALQQSFGRRLPPVDEVE